MYEYEFAKVQSEASTVHDQLVKLGPDDQEGNGVHTVSSSILSMHAWHAPFYKMLESTTMQI